MFYKIRLALPSAAIITAALALGSIGSCAAARISQHKINEIAAEVLEARKVLAGIKAPASPGESPAEFRSRTRQYVVSLVNLQKELAPIDHVPTLQDMSAGNLQLWRRVEAGVKELRANVSEVRATWNALPAPAARSRIGGRLIHALDTVEAILFLLRNARP